MYVLVQEITVKWTKKSRGGEAATKRNAVPPVFVFPTVEVSQAEHTLVHQKVQFDEPSQFELPNGKTKVETIIPYTKPLSIGCLTLWLESKTLRIKYFYSWTCAGAPRRHYPKIKNLEIGQWIQSTYNGRFASGWARVWTYHKTIFNIALLDKLNKDIFLTKPTYKFTDMADLR